MSRGYTIIELLIVMGLFAVFFSFASLNLLSVRSRTSLGATVDVLVSDLRTQQIKSMAGDTGGGAVDVNYGIYFSANSYTLFKGTYTSGATANFIVNLDEATVDTTFGSMIIFNKGSGEVVGTPGSIRLNSSSSNASKIIAINRFGTVTSIN